MLHFYLSKVWGIAKKVFIVVTVYIVVVGLFFTFIKQDQPKKSTINLDQQYQQQVYSLLNDPKITADKNNKFALNIIRGTLCNTIGQACTNNPNDDKKNFGKSLFGMVTAGIMLPYTNPPASGMYWAYSGLQNAGFIPKTYATAGVGFSSISLFMPIWKAFRDVTYILMVIILITIGFMIMFRMKMNPQTVVNIENSLPKVIITMLMITFSFAIAGFMIDFMYVVVILVIEIMSKAGNLNAVQQTNDILTGSALWTNQWEKFVLYWNGLNSLWQVIPGTIRTILGFVINLASFIILLRLTQSTSPIVSQLLGDTEIKGDVSFFTLIGTGVTINIARLFALLLTLGLSFVLTPIFIIAVILLVIIIGLLTLMFRIFFTLLYSYVQVLIYIMFAPVFLIPEALPGKKGFGPWFKNILGNLLVFPIVIALLLTIQVINQYASVGGLSNAINTNPLQSGMATGIFMPPLLSADSIHPQYFIAIINAVFLMIIPDLAKSFKQMIIGKEGVQLPTNVSALWGAAGAGLGGGIGILSQISSARLGLQATGLMKSDSTFGSFFSKILGKGGGGTPPQH